MTPSNGLVIFCMLCGYFVTEATVQHLQTYSCPRDPCFRKCCPEDQVWDLASRACKPGPGPNLIHLELFNITETPYIVFGKDCPADKEMIPLDDQKFQFLPNGQLLLANREVLALDNYCLDFADTENELSKLLLICSFQNSLNQLKSTEVEDYPTLEKISLQKCCEVSYSPFTRRCIAGEKIPGNWPPPFVSKATGTSLNLPEDALNITHSMTMCPSGYVRNFTTNYTLYDDGTVSIEGDFYDVAGAGFCVDVVDSGNFSDLFVSRTVVEYCKSDACIKGTACVKKCCPSGFVLFTSEDDWGCIPADYPFVPEFRDYDNNSLDLDTVHYITRFGDLPNCKHGFNMINPELYPQEMFYLLPDTGNLFMPDYPAVNDTEHSDYCIDNLGPEYIPVAFICFPPQPETDPATALALTVYPVVMSISVVFLIVTFLVYAVLPELKNLHGLTIMCHVFCLIVTFVSLSIIQTGAANDNMTLCTVTAIVAHFFFLSMFAWLNVMGFDLWLTFRDMRPRAAPDFKRTLRRLGFYSLFALGIPLVIVATGQVLDNVETKLVKPGFGTESCWFRGATEMAVYLYGPIGLSISSNIVFFAMTAVKLYQASKEAAFATQRTGSKERFRIILYLFVLMGVFWVAEIISFAAQGTSAYIWIFFDLLNILTGVFIFVIFVCKRQVIQLLRKRFRYFDRFWRFATKRHPNWNRSTEPSSTVSSKRTNSSQRVTASDPKRKITPTTCTNVTMSELRSETSDA